MEIRKTWFSYLALFLFAFGTLYILICGTGEIGTGQEYPYLAKGQLMLVLAVFFLAGHGAAILAARFHLDDWREKNRKLFQILEGAAVALILLASFAVRLWVVKSIPMAPESDYKTYYEIAQLLNKDALLEEGAGYCDYVAIFPHVLGYSAVLAFIFRTFGESVFMGQMFNIILAVGTCFFCWGIARMLAGRIAALLTLVMTAFWPSMVLYNNFLAAEYLFCFLTFGCLWLALHLVINVTPESKGLGKAVVLHIVLGIGLACAGAVRPMALLLLISICICLFPSKGKAAIRPRNDLGICCRIMEKGWLRALIILSSYLVVSAFLSKCVSFTIDRDLAGGTASMGYNLLVGLNTESYGGWNEQDSAYLYQVLEETGSAQQAQIACRDLAFQRLRGDYRSLLNLFMHKYTVLWSNDDYGITWNIIFLDQHKQLDSALESMLYSIQNGNNIWYLAAVFLSALGSLYLIRGKGNWSYILVLFFCGTVALHFLVENQNRYHFHCLYVFALLAAVGLHELYEDSKYRVVQGDARRKKQKEERLLEEQALQRIAEAEEYARKKQEESMSNAFDMIGALESGHIKVSVSESYCPQESKESKESDDGAAE